MAQFNLHQINSTHPTTSQVNSNTSNGTFGHGNDQYGQDHGMNDMVDADFTNMQHDGTMENTSEHYTWGNEQFEYDHQALSDAGAFYQDNAPEGLNGFLLTRYSDILGAPGGVERAQTSGPAKVRSRGLRGRGYEVAGYEVAGYEVAGYEVAGYEVAGYGVEDHEVANYQVVDYEVADYDLQQDEPNEHIRQAPQNNKLTDYDPQQAVPFGTDSTPPDVATRAHISTAFPKEYELPAPTAGTPSARSTITSGMSGGCTQSARDQGLAAVPLLVSARNVTVKVESPQDSCTGWKRKAQDEDCDDEEIKPSPKSSKILKSSKTPKRNGSRQTKQNDRHPQEYNTLVNFDCGRAELQVSHATDAAKAAITKLTQRHAKYIKVIKKPGNEEELRQTLAVEAELTKQLEAISEAVTAELDAKLGSWATA
ncbi:hypothetical protein LTR17_001169 [Elasticomyces elasticus]|nr:hypothetical protein LTR17_001169 [Elasticomyces elasticus]